MPCLDSDRCRLDTAQNLLTTATWGETLLHTRNYLTFGEGAEVIFHIPPLHLARCFTKVGLKHGQ